MIGTVELHFDVDLRLGYDLKPKMRFRLMNCERAGVWTICVLQCAALSAQEAGSLPRQGQPIEFSDPRPQTTVTNVSRLGHDINDVANESAPTGLPSSRVVPDTSLQAILPSPTPYVVPPPVVVRDRRSKEWMDPNADWTTMAPDEMLLQVALRNFLNGPYTDSRNTERGRPGTRTESVYEQILDSRSGWAPRGSGPAYSDDNSSFRPSAQKPDRASDYLDRSPSADEILGLDHDGTLSVPGARPESLTEMLGLLNNTPGLSVPGLETKQDAQARGAQVDAYQNLLNGVYEIHPAIAAQQPTQPSSPWLSGSQNPPPAVSLNPYATLPGSTVNPALLPPPAPTAPIPASLTPAPYNPEPPPPNNNMLLKSTTVDVVRRPF